MSSFIRFPDINQFRHVVKYVNQYNLPKQLVFLGTTKLHGTNAAVTVDFPPDADRRSDYEITFQSRERELTKENDNAGFVAEFGAQAEALAFAAHELFPTASRVTFFGEWCGGNIQKGVAINGLPKMFVVFAINVEGRWQPCTVLESLGEWLDNQFGDMPHRGRSLFCITQFPNASAVARVDFSDPVLLATSQQNFEWLVKRTEERCPVALALGVEGIGEGLVWTCVSPGMENDTSLWFKTKGEKHSVSKVTKVASVDVEKVKSIAEYVDATLTENRMQQGIAKLRELGKPVDEKSTGDFLRWIVGDIEKEEHDRREASNLTPNEVNKEISRRARAWYLDYVSGVIEWVKAHDEAAIAAAELGVDRDRSANEVEEWVDNKAAELIDAKKEAA